MWGRVSERGVGRHAVKMPPAAVLPFLSLVLLVAACAPASSPSPGQQGATERPSVQRTLVFVHGGAFMGGDRRTGDSPFYDNIMLWAVAQAWLV